MPVSDAEVEALRRELLRMHEANQRERVEDRKALTAAMNRQGEQFERGLESVKGVLLETRDLGRDNAKTLETLVGNGSRGEGRVGVLEEGFEKLKQFRWQVLAVLATVLFIAKMIWGK